MNQQHNASSIHAYSQQQSILRETDKLATNLKILNQEIKQVV